jgi:acyl carrier protein
MEIDLAAIRDILARHGRLSTDVQALEAGSSLYLAGLTSLATVGVMLALEEHFNVEFPRSMLSRKTFESIESIAEALGELLGNDPGTPAGSVIHHVACR